MRDASRHRTEPTPTVGPPSANGHPPLAAEVVAPSPPGPSLPATSGPTDDEGNGGPGSLAGRVLRPRTLLSFAIALTILFFVVRRFDIPLSEIWRNVRGANPWLYACAVAVWYASFFLRAARWRQMLGRVDIDRAHGYAVPGTFGMVEIFLLSWFANCVVPAKLGDAYRSYLLKQETGASFSTGLGTILAERLTDLTVLFLTMSAAALFVFHGQVPTAAAQTFLLGLGLLVVAAVGLAVMWFSRHALRRRLPPRIQEQYGRLSEAVFRCLRRPQLFFAISAVIWLGEGLRVFLVARAVGADLGFTTALFVALMGSLLTTLPITPAGLGVVESATVAVLVAFIGMEPSLAAAIILLDRVMSYWSVIAVGLLLYLRRARRALTMAEPPPPRTAS